MTRDHAVTAAVEIDARWLAPSRVAPEQSPRGVGVAHLRWMVFAMADGMSDDKTMRWLGYLQGALVCSGLATLDDMKDVSKRAAGVE